MPSFASLVDPTLDDADGPLALPPDPPSRRRPTVPVIATLVPVAGALGLWVVTGSVLSLWFAMLGPLVAGATLLDGVRTARRERRIAQSEMDAAHARLAASIGARHERELVRRRSRHPDVAGFALAEREVWRSVPGRSEVVVIGRGPAPSGLQVSGGGAAAATTELRRRALTLLESPIVVPAVGGIAVTGPPVLAVAVARALLLQLCLAAPPGDLRVVGSTPPGEEWIDLLPHRQATDGRAVALVVGGDAVPIDADVCIIGLPEGVAAPPGCGPVLTIAEPDRARLDIDGDLREVRVEGVSSVQARHFAEQLTSLAGELPGAADNDASPVRLGPLLPLTPRDGLSACIGMEGSTPAVIDLVADGPHAVVAGMTGSGKSELLVSWVLALCAGRSPREVSLLLADFKGGTAFDALAALPHVTGVITDLDGAGARRAIQSLRAEVRWREGELARVGARDVRDHRVELSRLVVVVDEFAALLGDHPELHAVFTDIAARGRALGMHLVLGTQRVSGVVRDALLANCPLRVSLRVADAADSRAVIGTDEASRISGGAHTRGVALVRRSADAAPRRIRVALSDRGDVAAIAAGADGHRPRRPWLPELPERVELDDLLSTPPAEHGADLVLGLADDPDRQRQTPVGVRMEDRGVLILGATGTGRTTALQTLGAQAQGTVVVPPDPEHAWDEVARLSDDRPPYGALILVDDVDALVSRYPHEYAQEFLARLERVIRAAGENRQLVIASAQRLAGPAARVVELLPRRVLLAAASRADYLALGGDATHHTLDQPRGRAHVDGMAVQIAVSARHHEQTVATTREWVPGDGVTGFAARRSTTTRAVVRRWEDGGARALSVEQAAERVHEGTGLETPGVRTLVVGDAEDWQRQWQLLRAVRDEHSLVIHPSVSADFRTLSADRTLPPYCAPGRPSAWLCRDGAPAIRILLPATMRVLEDAPAKSESP